MFKVIKNVPVPKTNRGDLPPRESKYPYAQLEVGDMFFVPDKSKNTLSTHTSTVGKKLGMFFSTRLTHMKYVDEDGDLVERSYEEGQWVPAEEDEDGAVLGIGVWRVGKQTRGPKKVKGSVEAAPPEPKPEENVEEGSEEGSGEPTDEEPAPVAAKGRSRRKAA